MRLKINAATPLDAIRGQDPAVLRAAVQIQLGLAHGLPDFQIPALFATRSDANVAEIAARLAGTTPMPLADASFDARETPWSQGVKSPALYHAMCVIYGWREFGWADIDEDDAARSLEANDPVAEAVDDRADDFGIEPVDAWTRKSLESVTSLTVTAA